MGGESIAVLRSPAVRARLEEQGFGVVANSTKDFVAYVNYQTRRWGQVIKDGKIKIRCGQRRSRQRRRRSSVRQLKKAILWASSPVLSGGDHLIDMVVKTSASNGANAYAS